MKKYALNAYNDDEVKNWAMESLKQLPFLKSLEPEKEASLLHKIYFSMTRKVLFAGELYMNPGKPIQHLTIIQDGILELYVSLIITYPVDYLRWQVILLGVADARFYLKLPKLLH